MTATAAMFRPERPDLVPLIAQSLRAIIIALIFAAAAPASAVAQYDFGDGSSAALTLRAWDALAAKDYDAVMAYAEKCIATFTEKAIEQQGYVPGFAEGEDAFAYWALNDVATCHLIRGKALREKNQPGEAMKDFQTIIDKYSYAQCWDPRNSAFWRVAEAARDQIQAIETGVDFGDVKSETLAARAWKALKAKKFEEAILYADKCINLYETTAREQQASLRGFPPKDKASGYWALNDVATCIFIKAKASAGLGKKDAALSLFKLLAKNFSYAQCWDPRGWFFKVARAAEDEIIMIEKGVDFGTFKSSELTTKAWETLQNDKPDLAVIYANKCVALYEKTAVQQQAGLKDFAPEASAHDHWALNDVATCWFIKAKALIKLENKESAKKILAAIPARFSFAQCWDTRGWFWKVARAAEDELLYIDSNLDFGDMSSATITGKAWGALNEKDYETAVLYARKCIGLYEGDAKKQQASLSSYPKDSEAHSFWALNDVATCYFILGNALTAQQKYSEAKSAYKKIIGDLYFAQCWDPQGWFWKVAVAARKELGKIGGKK